MKVVIVWLINERGEVLLSQRSSTISTDASVWGPSVSGVIDPGETAIEAGVRETQEELGVELDPTLVKHLHDEQEMHTDGEVREFNIYCTQVESAIDQAMQLEAEEVQATRWTPIDHLRAELEQKPETILMSYAAELWQKILKHLELDRLALLAD